MKTPLMSLLPALIALLSFPATAIEVDGQWHAEFEGRRGRQNIQFEFKAEGGKLTGKTLSQFGGEARELEIQDGKIEGDTLNLVQVMQFQGN